MGCYPVIHLRGRQHRCFDIEIQADSVDTGSGMKNSKLRGKDFFNVSQDPFITFKSTKIEQTGPDTFAVDGDFTIRN